MIELRKENCKVDICRVPHARQSKALGIFYCGYQAQGRSSHTPGSGKNTSAPVGIFLKCFEFENS